MPYVQVQPEDLQIGQEYVLTLKGIESRTEGAEYETVPVYDYGYTPPGKQPRQTGTKVQMKMPPIVVAQPTATGKLLGAYRALRMWQKRDNPATSYAWNAKNRETIDINYIRRKGFFAGIKANGLLVFSQERGFGSSKPVTFIPVDVNENNKWGQPMHTGLSPNDYAFWKTQSNNTRRNKSNLVTGNLLGLNNVQSKENTRTTQQALNNVYKQHEMEQNLKGVLAGGRKTRRSRTY
jgi:hypothetical protein